LERPFSYTPKEMIAIKIALYPFASSDSISDNLTAIRTGIQLAAAQNVRLIAFHECSLCGYPPIESNISEITETKINSALNEISTLARQHRMYIAVGTVRFECGKRFNSIVLFNDLGKIEGFYDKSALWGWDTDHFSPGEQPGIFDIDGIRIGFRICFDVRFPECFRALYHKNVNLCIVAFSDSADAPDPERYEIIKSHLRTRAVENVMTVLSVNTLSRHSTAPTAVFNPDGRIISEAPTDPSSLLVYDFQIPEITFGRLGRIKNANRFLQQAHHIDKLHP